MIIIENVVYVNIPYLIILGIFRPNLRRTFGHLMRNDPSANYTCDHPTPKLSKNVASVCDYTTKSLDTCDTTFWHAEPKLSCYVRSIYFILGHNHIYNTFCTIASVWM